MGTVDHTERGGGYLLVLGFTVLSLWIIVVGVFYYRHHERQLRIRIEQQLSAITELKVDELAQYRKERLGDAAIFFKNPAFSGLVQRFIDHPEDAEAQQQLRTWLDKSQSDQYDLVCLFDAQGAVRMSVPAGRTPVSSAVLQRIPEVLQSGRLTFQDFNRNEHDQRPYLTLLVPILDADRGQALGVVALRIDPETYLYPFIKRWPTPSRTAETQLVRREGNDVVFLNELKFQTNTALALRVSLDKTERPAVKAVLKQEGIVEGLDYRGVPVIADVRAVPDSPWFMVARMDTAEAYAPLRERLWLTLVLVSVLLLGAGAGAGAIWRHQRLRFYQERAQVAETMRESEERFRRVFEEGPIGMAMLDEKFHFIRVNPAFTSMLGYSAEDMRTMTFPGITHPDNVQRDVEEVRRLLRGELSVYRAEKRYITKSGKELWGLVHVSVVRNAAGEFRHLLAIISSIAERKQAEEALANERALLRSLVDHLPLAVYLKDLDGRKILANRLELDYLGATSEAEVLGKTDFDFFPQEQAALYQAFDREIIRTGKPLVNHAASFTKPDGSVVYLLASAVPLRDAAGRVTGLLGINLDITDRKQAEEAQRLSEERLLRVITQTRCILNFGQVEGPAGWRERALSSESPFRWDFQVQNEEAAQKVVPLELAPGESYQHAWFRSRNRADQDQMNWNSGNAFLNDLPFYRNEFQCTDKNGVGHWMQQFVSVQKLAENRWQVFGITTDISDLKRVEMELRRSETGLEAILESTADGILAVDSKGKLIKANRRFAELWRIPQPLMGAGDDRILLDLAAKQLSDPDTFFKKVQLLYHTKAADMDTLVFKDGRIFESYSFPMMMEGKAIGRVWSFRDITERKRQEEELRQKNSELERFTYTVSHDLKSPLVTVKTFLGYLEQDLARPDLERVKQDVAYMHTATTKMGQLLDELLNLARVGRKSNPPVRVTFPELAQEAVRLVAGRISTGGVKVQVADAVVTLEGDRPRLMEIWQNLLENACKFMGNQPRPQVEIGVERRGPETVFFVRDNGAGIEPRYQTKLFGLFEQLDPKGEGTGMGLALVKRIVELYHGRIWVESAGPGQGANFLFTLPGAVITDKEPSA